jgi:hypothetical protein
VVEVVVAVLMAVVELEAELVDLPIMLLSLFRLEVIL